MNDKLDPVKTAWLASPHNGPFPKELELSAAERAGYANAAEHRNGKGPNMVVRT